MSGEWLPVVPGEGIAMANNDFLSRQKERDRKLFDAGMMFGLQLANDYYQMTLNNPEVMGSRVLGRAMIEKIAAHTKVLDDHFSNAFTGHVEADFLQEEMDGILRNIWKEDLAPFPERYPIVKQYSYMKSRKGWK